MDDLDKIMKELLDHDQFFRLHQEALSEIHQRVRKGEKMVRHQFFPCHRNLLEYRQIYLLSMMLP